MRVLCQLLILLGLSLALLQGAWAELGRNMPAPDIKAVDINGAQVDIDELLKSKPYLVIVHFFSVSESEVDLAKKLRYIHKRYEKIPVIALGLQEDEAALKKFAVDLDIDYHIINADTLAQAPWLNDVDVLPMTLFVQGDSQRTIDTVIKGGGQSKASLLAQLAERLYRQGETAAAEEAAQEALTQGEDENSTRETLGFIYIESGKLDEAEAEFGAIDSKSGMAAVKLEQGDAEGAIALADSAENDGYALTVKAKAQLSQGEVDAASKTLEDSEGLPAREWQKSEAVNTQGRIAQENGDTDAAIKKYENAIALDPSNVKALSNEAAAHRESGNLAKAEAAIEKASAVGQSDQMVQLMLGQIQMELQNANDVKRGELIRSQIADLSKSFEEMKASGAGASLDEWSTRPLVLALLPSPSGAPVFFERAGSEIVIQRELESRLQVNNRVSVVEREMLDKLLQELNLGSSELADSSTQRRLGQVLSAGMLGFIEFANAGGKPTLYLRLVDTETTSIVFQTSQVVDAKNLAAVVGAVADAVLAEVANGRELKGLIADAESNDAIIINLGKKHGVSEGMEFAVLEEGDPIEVGGRIIAHRQRVIGTIKVTTAEDDYAICSAEGGVKVAKEMKIKAK